ncbi:uncharacterized protein J4E78_008587 [Alternaria triticimaculans]|uniref:uncharacterized protein n=1 Tax=Alternaria triticimaculans TaxID=297637 RepID=UPI0020C4981B|nr:uncharacterized protein J4E78_008587 [Alternaria triticimaculans]KAI4649069.1 hypothetical protein J4E78_008587 [Alternaria triticimaculans]
MFNPIRKLLRFWSAADTSATTSSNDASTKDVATESTAYRAACNHAAPPARYGSGEFNTTPSPPPNAALSAYLFSQVKNTNTSTSRMSNIPPPPFPMFSAPTGNSTDNASTTSDDIDMPDARPMSPLTPPTTPSRDSDDVRPSVETPAQEDVHGATAQDNDTSEPRNDTAPPPSPERDNPHSQPPRQQDRQQTTPPSEPLPNWLDEIIIEEDIPENALPVGYMGTFRGSRHFIPEYPGMKRCSNQVTHLLLCGHWIASTEPCGANCKKQDHTHKQFKCPTCNDIVRNILTGSFQPADSMRLREFRKQKDVKFLACCVEQVVRAAPELKNGVTEAVAGFLCKDSGRECEGAENPDPGGHDTIEEIVRDMQERYERRQRERRMREREEEGNMHEKSARDEDAADENGDAETSTKGDTPGDNKHGRNDASPGNDENHDTAPRTNKKRKTHLETHREPITPSTRGTKRRSPFSPSPSPSTPTSSSTSSSSSPTASPFAYLPNSKPPSSPYPSPPPKKRVFEKPDPAFGEASFVIAPPHVVGPLMRKRHADVYVEGDIERESKRRRSQENEGEGERGREGIRGDRSGRGKGSGSGSGGITWKEFEAFRRAWDGREEEDEEGECEL